MGSGIRFQPVPCSTIFSASKLVIVPSSRMDLSKSVCEYRKPGRVYTARRITRSLVMLLPLMSTLLKVACLPSTRRISTSTESPTMVVSTGVTLKNR